MGYTTQYLDVKTALKVINIGIYEVKSASNIQYFNSKSWQKDVWQCEKVDDKDIYFFRLRNGDFVEVEKITDESSPWDGEQGKRF